MSSGLSAEVAETARRRAALEEEAAARLMADEESGLGGAHVHVFPDNVASVAAGGYFSAALLANGTVCIRGMGVAPMSSNGIQCISGSWRRITAGSYSLYLLDDHGGLFVIDMRPSDNDSVVAAPRQHSAGVVAMCAGHDDWAVLQLSGSKGEFSVAGVVASVPWKSQVAQLVCGSQYALVRTVDGELWGVGSNAWGQLATPVSRLKHSDQWLRLDMPGNVVLVAAGGDHAMAVVQKNDNNNNDNDNNNNNDNNNDNDNNFQLVAWGWAEHGQLGVGFTQLQRIARPTVLSKLEFVARGIRSLGGGGYAHSGAVDAHGRVYMWGSNEHNALGLTDSPNGAAPVWRPEAVSHIDDAVDIASGGFKHTLVLLRNGTVVGFGSNFYSQLK